MPLDSGIDRGFAWMRRIPVDSFRKSSACIRPIRQIRGLFPHASLEITLASRRHPAKLLQPAERILFAPVLNNLAIGDTEDRDRRECGLRAARRNTHELTATMRAAEGHARHDLVALADQILGG